MRATFWTVFLWAASTAQAQVEVLRVYGDTGGDGFGTKLVHLGDVDGDGRADWAVGEPLFDGAAGANCGRVRVFSGSTHAPLWTVEGASGDEYFGAALAKAGDFDADGRNDLLVGAPRCSSCAGGRVLVLSGSSGAELLQFNALPSDRNFGAALAGGHDVNGDGGLDVLVGAPASFTNGAGVVRVYDGSTGASIRTHGPAQLDYSRCGWAVAFLGDLDGDGKSEYVFSSIEGQGLVEAHDGASGALLWQREGAVDPFAGDQLGWVLAPIGDQNFDGRPDLIATAPQDATTEAWAQGYALVLDGWTGALLARFGPAPQIFTYMGDAAVAVEDVDGDGREDVALTAPRRIPAVRIFSVAAPAAPRVTIDAGVAFRSGLAFGDVSGDELPDLVLGLSGVSFSLSSLGEVRAYSLVLSPTSYCAAEVNSQGCTPAIGFVGAASVSSTQPFLITAVDLLNHKTGLVFYGFAPQQTPFAGGNACIVPPRQRTPHQFSGGNLPPASDCSGTIALDFNARIQSGVDAQLVAGRAVFAQLWSRDPADPSGTNLSDALAFPIGL